MGNMIRPVWFFSIRVSTSSREITGIPNRTMTKWYASSVIINVNSSQWNVLVADEQLWSMPTNNPYSFIDVHSTDRWEITIDHQCRDYGLSFTQLIKQTGLFVTSRLCEIIFRCYKGPPTNGLRPLQNKDFILDCLGYDPNITNGLVLKICNAFKDCFPVMTIWLCQSNSHLNCKPKTLQVVATKLANNATWINPFEPSCQPREGNIC